MNNWISNMIVQKNGVELWVAVGNLTADAELRYTGRGTPVLNGTIACDVFMVGEDKRAKEKKTEYVRFSLFGPAAERNLKMMKTGTLVLLTGKPVQQTWEKDGETKAAVTMVLDFWQYLHSKAPGKEGQAPQRKQVDTRQRRNLLFSNSNDPVAQLKAKLKGKEKKEEKPVGDQQDTDLPN